MSETTPTADGGRDGWFAATRSEFRMLLIVVTGVTALYNGAHGDYALALPLAAFAVLKLREALRERN